jgi:hypothetical protein
MALPPGLYPHISNLFYGTVTDMLYCSVNKETPLLSLASGQSQEDMGGFLAKMSKDCIRFARPEGY